MNYKQFKAVFADVLVPLGYTPLKNSFFRRKAHVFTIVYLQKSDFGGDYYVNIGVFVDEEGTLSHPPAFHHAHLLQRLEAIVSQSVRDSLIPALDLEVAMSAKERTAVISNVMQRYVVPYLDSVSTIEGIADYLSPQKGNFAGVTLALREIIHRRCAGSASFSS